MNKLVQINVVCNGSTGRIMCDIAKEASKKGYETYCFYGRGKGDKSINCIKFNTKLSIYFHVLLARIGFNGHGSFFATKKLVKQLQKISPDIIHMHNIHGYYINLKILFKYLKNEYKGKVVWTLHDCWTFTGHCSYFTMAKCNKWQKKCSNCPQLNVYPKTLFDTTKSEYILKQELFTNIKNLTLVTPSKWLKGLVGQSFLKNYNVEVINNGIDLSIFKPTYDKLIFEKYNIPKNKKIILGVANIWEERKGLKDFIKLSSIIDDNYIIVLLGKLMSNEISNISNIIHIDRTDNQTELAKIYTIADVFFNPTYEDNYPTTNLEAIACGTKVVAYNTGGCKEQFFDDVGTLISNDCLTEIVNQIGVKKRKNISRFESIDVNLTYLQYFNIY